MRHWITGFGSDVRLALRGLWRSPGFTTVTAVTLALGLGGSAAIYTLLDRVVLDPLPYPEPDRLVKLENRVPGVSAETRWNMSTAQYVYFAEHSRSLEAIGLFRGFGANIDFASGPQRVQGWRVTASMFPLLGATAHLGRVINPDDDLPGGPPIVLLSHGIWRRHYGNNENIVGQSIEIDVRRFEVIGVLEPGVRMPGSTLGAPADLWVPLRIDPAGFFGNNHVFPMFARLAPGMDVTSVESEIAALTPRLVDRFPSAYSQDFFDRYGFRTQATPLKEAIVGDISRNLWILFGAVGFVLLIAGANVANLFLVRMDGRQRELAVRSALGASRPAIARHVLAESWVLSFLGGGLALLIGFWGVPGLVALAPGTLPRIEGLQLDGGTMVFTALLSFLVGIGIAAYPLARRPSGALSNRLSGGGRSASATRNRARLRAGLVVTQMALALTLLAGSGLLLESMRRLGQVDPGLDPHGVFTAGLFLNADRYENDAAIWTAYRQILDGVRAIPGVEGAGMTSELPILGGFGCTVQAFEDSRVHERLGDEGLTTCAGQEPTTPGYFEAAGIPVLQGRSFTDADNDSPDTRAVVVSRAFAERFWPGEDPIGMGVAPSGRSVGPFYHVVGVVGDVPAGSLDGETAIAIYYPIVHDPNSPGNWDWWFPSNTSLVVRTGLADPLTILPQVRQAIQQVDPTIPVAHAASMDRIIASSMARLRFTSLLLGIAAAVALLLAAVGLYGVVSYVVGRRTREIGIRIAIGALPATVSREVIGRSLTMVAVGLVVGLAMAAATTQAMKGLLYGVESTDPGAFLGAALLLAAVAGLASWVPARRASRIDPVEALRAE